jgi:hypothetical protein
VLRLTSGVAFLPAAQGPVLLLAMQLMEGGTLRSALLQPEGQRVLAWRARWAIVHLLPTSRPACRFFPEVWGAMERSTAAAELTAAPPGRWC